MPWKNSGTKVSVNKTGIYHSKVKEKIDDLGNTTDIIWTPVSDNPTNDHGHAWGINTDNGGSRQPGERSGKIKGKNK